MILALLLCASFEDGLALKRQEKFAEAATVFAGLVQENPRDGKALAQWATLLGWLGQYDASISAWRRAVDLKPDDPDAAIGLSRVQYWKGELPAARAQIAAVLQRAPGNLEALVLCGDTALAAHDFPAARDCYLRARAASPDPRDLDLKLARLQPPSRRVDAGGTIDRYDTARGREGSFFAQASVQASEALVLSAGYEQLRQFGFVDHRINATGYLRASDDLLLSARLAVSPDAKTIANWELAGNAELRLASFATALFGARHPDFSNNGVTLFGPGARLDWGSFTLAVQAGAVYSTASALSGYGQARLEYAVTDPVHVYAGFSRGVETQLLLAAAATTDLTAGVLWQVAPALGLRLDYTHEVRERTYTRDSLGSAVTVRF